MKRVEKPWGYELWWAQTDKYVGKILHVDAGHQLSLQYHDQKDETLYLLNGEMDMQFGPNADQLETKRMQPGDVHYNPPKLVHRMIAVTDVDILEVSTPEVEDVVRLEDSYGRIDHT
jgi:mannose-6-phosphate isomerase-like protein (cupin superfamily)